MPLAGGSGSAMEIAYCIPQVRSRIHGIKIYRCNTLIPYWNILKLVSTLLNPAPTPPQNLLGGFLTLHLWAPVCVYLFAQYLKDY